MFSAHQVKQNQSEVETLSSLSPNDLARAINIAPPQRKNDSAPHADLNQHWIWASIWASWGAKEYERHHRASPFLNMVMPCSLLKRCHRSCFLKSYWSLGLTWSYTIYFLKALQDIHRYSRLEADRHDFRTNKQPQGSAAHSKFVLWLWTCPRRSTERNQMHFLAGRDEESKFLVNLARPEGTVQMNKPLHHVHSFGSSVACFSLSHSFSLLSQSSYIILTSEAVALHVPRERCSLEFAWLQRVQRWPTLCCAHTSWLGHEGRISLGRLKQPVFPPSFTCFILLRLYLQVYHHLPLRFQFQHVSL